MIRRRTIDYSEDQFWDELIRLSLINEAEPPDEDTETAEEITPIQFTHQQWLKMKRASDKRSPDRDRINSAYTSRLVKTMSVIIVLLMGILIGVPVAVASNPYIRSSIMNLVMSLDSGYANIHLEPTDVFTVPTGYKGEYYPAFTPAEYDRIWVSETGKNVMLFSKDSPGFVSYDECDDNTHLLIDIKEAQLSNMTLNGNPAFVIEKECEIKEGTFNMFTIIWSIDDKWFVVSSPIDLENAIQIAQSVHHIVSKD